MVWMGFSQLVEVSKNKAKHELLPGTPQISALHHGFGSWPPSHHVSRFSARAIYVGLALMIYACVSLNSTLTALAQSHANLSKVASNVRCPTSSFLGETGQALLHLPSCFSHSKCPLGGLVKASWFHSVICAGDLIAGNDPQALKSILVS